MHGFFNLWMDFKILAKSSKTRWVFYLNFLFQPNQTKNIEMKEKKKKKTFFLPRPKKPNLCLVRARVSPGPCALK
jgi:hypothetical protein